MVVKAPFSFLKKKKIPFESFENIIVLDSYFIHGYIMIKYRSSSI